MNTTQQTNSKSSTQRQRHPSQTEGNLCQVNSTQSEKQNSQQQQQSNFEQQYQQYKMFAEQENQNTFEITKILKQNINRFYKINKIDLAEQAKTNKQSNQIVSFLDKFSTKTKYQQNLNYMMYEEATSGEESPKYNFTNSSDDSYQDNRRSDDENEFSNSSDKSYDSSDDEDNESDDSEDNSDDDSYSERESSKSSNNRKKHKKNDQMEDENQRSDKQSKKINRHHSDEEDSSEFQNRDNMERKNKSQNMKDEKEEHLLEQEYPEQGNLLYQLQSKMALEKKNMQKDRQNSSSSSRERKKKIQKASDSKKKGIQKGKHKKKHRDSPNRKKSKKYSEKQKSILRKKLNHDNGNNYKGSKDVASLEDIYLNFFDFHSYDIVSSLKEAELYPDIPKIYIEDPQNECDEHEIYKIVISLSKLDTSAVKNKKKVRNFSIIYVENVKVLIFDFYRKSTSIIVSKHLLDLPTKNNRNLLPKSLKFKWALDKRANPEYLKSYYACIFRNIPKFTAQQISQFILNKHPHLKLKCVEEPTYIKNQNCTIAQFETVEDCEYACTVFHKQNWLNPKYKVKCNIHPKCSFQRNQQAKDDKNKIFFVQSNVLKRCKLFKCRMKKEWFEDQILPPQIKQEEITYKNSLLRFQKIKLPNSFISSDDLSDEESFQEYRFLYQENTNKSNKQNKNNNNQNSNNNNNINNNFNSQYLNSNNNGSNNNNSNNNNSNQNANLTSNASNNNNNHQGSSRFHSNNGNSNNNNNNTISSQQNSQNVNSGNKQQDNDPLSILRQSSQMNSNAYQMNNMRTGQDNRKSNNNNNSNYNEEKQNQNQQKSKGMSNVKLNDILKNSSGIIGMQYQEDMQQSKQSSSSMLQSTNDSHSCQNREEEAQNDIGITSTMHSSRAMNIYGSNQSSSKSNRMDRDKDANSQKQGQKRQTDSKSQQDDKSHKNSGKQNIQQFEQIKKISKTETQSNSKFQNSSQQQGQSQQIQVNQILTNSSSIPPNPIQLPNSQSQQTSNQPPQYPNTQQSQQQQVIQNPTAIQPISQQAQQIQIGSQVTPTALPQNANQQQMQQIPAILLQPQQIQNQIPNRNQIIPQQFPQQPNQPPIMVMGQIQPVQQQNQIMQPLIPGQVQGQAQQTQQAYPGSQVLPQQVQVNQFMPGQAGQMPMQQQIFQGMVQQIPNPQGSAIIQPQPVPYGMIQNPQTGQVIPAIVQQVQPNMVQQPQIVMGQQPMYGQAHGYRMQGGQIQMQNQQIVQQIPPHQMMQAKQPQALVYGQPGPQAVVFAQPPQQIIHHHPHMAVVNQNMIQQPGQIIQQAQNSSLGIPQQIPIIQQYPNQVGVIQGVQPIINPSDQQVKSAIAQPTQILDDKTRQQEEKRLQLLKEIINPSNQHAPQPPQEQAPNTPSTPPTPPSPPTPPPEPM
ncbi:hypothetical protein TTHERM_01079240 (macronuclear) [Tetrahymena thermophila SB210]|uniref:Uncharacterized protein n=1 Tax=Tetrahymena thermophila (strain SB210) TaxID=312017 RepID=Q24CC7_TETTS|nr:hypothetical protein TTHERM_01079240 [Tetrahymena thermophila SB210]EAS05447.1 hypothetical protein TTHERM_01079240 [Tetrahymena thermophila SB210]|eukprot:XP_001025692.1 hypothetical protein TTHERM_01079240 [Tetrahymena thermophila SB210]